VRDGISFLLKCSGILTRTYDSAVALLNRAEGLSPGCIVSDVRMPDMDGLQLLQRLKEKGLPHPVIIVTGHGDVALAVEAMRAGALDFLEKPFKDETLLASVNSALDINAQASRKGAAKDQLRATLRSL